MSMQKMTREEIKTLLITVCMAACGMLGVDIHLASMPHIMQYLHTNEMHMQQSISGFLLGMGLSLLIYGPLSDAYGRKPLVIIGLLIATLASFVCAYSDSIQMFLVCRLLQGIGAGVCMGLGRTIAIDVLQGERFTTVGSYFGMFLSLSPLLAPMLGGYIEHNLGWQANFFVLSGIMFVVLIVYALFCLKPIKTLKLSV